MIFKLILNFYKNNFKKIEIYIINPLTSPCAGPLHLNGYENIETPSLDKVK